MVNRSHYDFCTELSPECPLNETLYGYIPNLGVNAFFAVLFGILLIAQLTIGTWTRTWTYMLAVGVGVFGEMVGYIGRLVMRRNPWAQPGFETQICCLVLAPSFLAAGIYVTLKHMVLYGGPQFSRLRPNRYPWIFIGSDLGSIVVQAIGGGVAASADHANKHSKQLLNAGDALIIAGIALQSVTMLVCGSLILDFFLRRRKAQRTAAQQTSGKSEKMEEARIANPDRDMDTTTTDLPTDDHDPQATSTTPRRFRLFCYAIGFATFTILVRCIYRLPEMAGGWGNPRMRDETTFLILDGMMIALASIALTIAHPGFMFPPMRMGGKKVSMRGGSR